MPRSYLGRRLGQILGGIVSEPGPHRERSGRFLRVEPLESRALLANIYPSGVISSTPDGSDFQYTIALDKLKRQRRFNRYVLVRVGPRSRLPGNQPDFDHSTSRLERARDQPGPSGWLWH